MKVKLHKKNLPAANSSNILPVKLKSGNNDLKQTLFITVLLERNRSVERVSVSELTSQPLWFTLTSASWCAADEQQTPADGESGKIKTSKWTKTPASHQKMAAVCREEVMNISNLTHAQSYKLKMLEKYPCL